MNRTIASLSQWAGRITVIIAMIYLIWTVADLATESSDGFNRPSLGPNQYVQVLATATSIAVSGMLAIGIGMMLERFNDE